MFDEIEEDEREVRRLQRRELFRRPKPKLPEQQGDVMERREPDKWSRGNDSLISRRNIRDGQNRIVASAIDEYKAEQIVAEHNQHAALVEQRNRLVEVLAALKEAMKVVSDRAAGGRMLTTVKEAGDIWGRCAKAIFDTRDIEQGDEA